MKKLHYFLLLSFVIFSPKAFSQNKENGKDNIAIIKDYYKAFNENNPKKMASFFADGFINYGYGSKPPVTYKTSDEYEKKLEVSYKDVNCISSNEEYFSDGNAKVVVLADYTETMISDIYGTKGRSHTHRMPMFTS